MTDLQSAGDKIVDSKPWFSFSFLLDYLKKPSTHEDRTDAIDHFISFEWYPHPDNVEKDQKEEV